MNTEQLANNLWRIGIQRRKRDFRFMRKMAGLMCFFLTIVLLFQDNMNRYQMEMNYQNYGKWIIREPIATRGNDACSGNPYIKACGEIWTGGMIYKGEGNDPKDLEIDATDDSRISEKHIGVLDTGIITNGNLELYEGRFPENSNEITMELNTLQALGYHYDLGQKISFYLPETEPDLNVTAEDEKILLHQVTFTLVGTLKAYTTVWNGGEALPGAIIQKEVFDTLTMAKTGHRFYQIKEKYVDADVSLFAPKLMDSLMQSITDQLPVGSSFYDMGYQENFFAYSNPFWSNKTMYRNMTVILIILCSAIMAYLMSVHLLKRKKYYWRLREIGATLGQVLHMSAYECIGSMGPAILVGLIAAYGSSVFVVWIVAAYADISFFYYLQWKTLLEIFLSVGIVLGISFLCSWFIFHSSRITEKRNKLSKFSVWILRKRAQKHKRLTIKEWEKRFRICQPVSVVLMRLIGIGVCICVLACLMQIYDKIVVYHFICEDRSDFRITKKDSVSMDADVAVITPYLDYDGQEKNTCYISDGDEIQTMQQVIPNEMLQSIQAMKGIQSLNGSIRDDSHVFDWKNKDQSKSYQDYMNPEDVIQGNKQVVFDRSILSGQAYADYIVMDTSTDSGRTYWNFRDSLMYEGRYYQNTKQIWEKLQQYPLNAKANYRDFCDGEQIILLEKTTKSVFIPSDDVEENSSTEIEVEPDATIQAGDELVIHTRGQDVSVTVGSILSIEETSYEFGNRPYSIVGSEALGRKIAEEDGIPFGYNYLEINFNGLSSSEATDKIITRQCTIHDLQYNSDAEERRNAFQSIIQSILVYGGLAVIIIILYLFILSCILLEEYRRKRKQQVALLQLGATPRHASRRPLRNGIREILYLLWSIPFLYLIQLLKISAEWNSDKANGDVTIKIISQFFNKSIYKVTEIQYLFYSLVDSVNLYWVIIYLLMMGLVVTALHIAIGTMTRKEDTAKEGNGGEGHE